MSMKRNDETKTNGNGTQTKEKKENGQNSNENFDPPDGGWGWIIVVAAGFSNFCIFPLLQSFGLIYKNKLAELGISTSQTTTMLNVNYAVTSCIGLINGPLFRKFSFRQVAFVGAFICAISITVLSTMRSFVGLVFFFSVLYAIGIGITLSSNALALNTYFKKKRRIATGLSWTCSGLGPIILPQILTFLIPKYDVDGTTFIIGGFAFNAVACALLLQPLSHHIKKKQSTNQLNDNENLECKDSSTYMKIRTESPNQNKENTYVAKTLGNGSESSRYSYSALSLAKEKFGSQYLYYDDEEDGASGIDVMGPGVLMMSRANDGWFSRKNTSTASIASRASRREDVSRIPSRRTSITISRQSSLSRGSSIKTFNRQLSDTEAYRRTSGYQSSVPSRIIVSELVEKPDNPKDLKNNRIPEETTVIPEEVESDQLLQEKPVEANEKTFWEALIIFFDLDLLRDPIYVNLMIGLTLATFAELNFSLLTPFILAEYGFTNIQVATFMSILAGVDVITRLTIPFIANFIQWSNRTFFLVGICQMAVGRIVLAHVQNFGVSLAISVLLGVGKGLRTIFMALVIPSHVPLSRLPGATGLQLLTSGIIAISLGPLVGSIRDVTSDYSITLHSLNILTFFTTISWCIESYISRRKSKMAAQMKENPDNPLDV